MKTVACGALRLQDLGRHISLLDELCGLVCGEALHVNRANQGKLDIALLIDPETAGQFRRIEHGHFDQVAGADGEGRRGRRRRRWKLPAAARDSGQRRGQERPSPTALRTRMISSSYRFSSSSSSYPYARS